MLLKLWEALAGTIILIKYTMAALDEVERLDCQGNLVGKPTQQPLFLTPNHTLEAVKKSLMLMDQQEAYTIGRVFQM